MKTLRGKFLKEAFPIGYVKIGRLRKNSLFFGSNRMVNVSAANYTLISTCRTNGIFALVYLKKFFREVVKGRRDYENLLPMTIEINTNKLKNQIRFLKT